MTRAPGSIQYRLPRGLVDSPGQAFDVLLRSKHPYWLDSGDEAGPHARYAFLGCDPRDWIQSAEAPFAALRAQLEALDMGTANPVPAARVVGWLSYELGRHLEALPTPPAGDSPPEMVLAVYDACLTFDLTTGDSWITAVDNASAAALECALTLPPAPESEAPLTVGPPTSRTTELEYAAQIDRVQTYIRNGDCYQVNLSHRFDAQLRPGTSAADLYRRLRRRHPACYGAYFDAGHTQLCSNSPEGFLDIDLRPGRRRVTTWPLKGTRPHDSCPEALRLSEKDRAEHVMIVDLERNDLGRIAVPGTVQVPRLLDVVRHPTVLHLESRIDAVPRDGVDLVDVLAATFPGGSITGAPKIRSMEIIAELEGERRGPYCGAMGYVAFGGLRSTWNIPIRTAVIQGSALSLRVGGGVVADSEADAEWAETLTKARAFLDVLA